MIGDAARLMGEFASAGAARRAKLIRKARKRLYEGSLLEFQRAAWPIIEPGREFLRNWHVDAMSEHLEAVTRGDIKRLIINISPGTGKSIGVSVCWPCWSWALDPHSRWIFGSYKAANTVRDSRKRREILKSRWFRTHWWGWRIKDDQDTAVRFENSRQGFMLATSVGGGGTGEHGNYLVFDDPHDRMDRYSKAKREASINWERTVFSSLNLGPDTRHVVIAQRITEDDQTGQLLAKELGYEHLCIPLLYDSGHPCAGKPTRLGWRDPRTQEGESMWPAMFPPESIAGLKAEKGSYDFSCTPGESPILMADWTCKRIDEVRPGDEVVGFRRGTSCARAQLVKANVNKIFSRRGLVCTFILESGRTVRCTRDHRWYTTRKEGKEPSDSRRASYTSAKVGSRLMFVEPTADETTEEERRDWHYLAGIIDGEGSVGHGHLQISQSPEANEDVWNGILSVLNRLNLPYTIWTGEHAQKKENWSRIGHITIKDTRDVARKLLRLTPLAKRNRILKWMFSRGHKFIKERDAVKEIRVDGIETVYALETATGNYVVWGYASSNSQYQQTPTPDQGGIFSRKNFSYFTTEGSRDDEVLTLLTREGPERRVMASECLWFQACDTALMAKESADWTVVGTFAVTPQPVALLVYDIYREKLPVPRQYGMLVAQRQRHPRVAFQAVEEKASGIGLIQEGVMRGTPFRILKAEQSKERRAVPISIQYENGSVYHRAGAPWLDAFESELCFFPASQWDDQVDVLAHSGFIVQQHFWKQAVGGLTAAYIDEKTDEEKAVVVPREAAPKPEWAEFAQEERADTSQWGRGFGRQF